MISVIMRELKDRRVSLVAYCAVAVATLLVYLSIYPSFHDSIDKLQQLYQSYPQEFYKAMGIENFNISTTEGFMAVEYFSIVWSLLAIFFATSRAGSAIAGEIEKGVMNFYLMLPISRVRIYISKYLSFMVSMVLFILTSIVSILPLAALTGNDIAVEKIWSVTLLSLVFTWAVYAASMFVSAMFSERSKVYMIIGGVLLVMYILSIISGLKTDLEWLQNYSIFHYYYAQDILNDNAFKGEPYLLFGSMIVVFSAAGALIFRRRDIAN